MLPRRVSRHDIQTHIGAIIYPERIISVSMLVSLPMYPRPPSFPNLFDLGCLGRRQDRQRAKAGFGRDFFQW